MRVSFLPLRSRKNQQLCQLLAGLKFSWESRFSATHSLSDFPPAATQCQTISKHAALFMPPSTHMCTGLYTYVSDRYISPARTKLSFRRRSQRTKRSSGGKGGHTTSNKPALTPSKLVNRDTARI